MTDTIINLEDITKEKNLRRARDALSVLAESLIYRSASKNEGKDKIKVTVAVIKKLLPYLMNYLSIIPNLRGSVRKELLIDSLDEALTVYKEKFPHDRDNALELKSWISSEDFSSHVDSIYEKYPHGSKFRSDLRVAYKNRKKKQGDFKTGLELNIDLTQMTIDKDDLTTKCVGGAHKFTPYVNAKQKKTIKWIKKSALDDMSNIAVDNGIVRAGNLMLVRADADLINILKDKMPFKDIYELDEAAIVAQAKTVLLAEGTDQAEIDLLFALTGGVYTNAELVAWLEDIQDYKDKVDELLDKVEDYLDNVDLDLFKDLDGDEIEEKVRELLEDEFGADYPVEDILDKIIGFQVYVDFEAKVAEHNKPEPIPDPEPEPEPKPKPVIIVTKPRVKPVANKPVRQRTRPQKSRAKAQGAEMSRTGTKNGPRIVPIASRPNK